MKDFGKSRAGRCGLPQESVIRDYPKVKSPSDGDIDDTMEDMDSVCKQAEVKQRKYRSNQK